jgi:hypothetical protein
VAQQHLGGVYAMATASGGLGKMGLSELLDQMYRKFVEKTMKGNEIGSVLCQRFHLNP